MEFHESLGQSLVEGVAGVVGGQVEVVERGVAATTVDGDAPSVEDEANVTGDVVLGGVDECVEGTFEGVRTRVRRRLPRTSGRR